MWKHSRNRLVLILRFGDFKEALEFVDCVGDIAEKIQHHPDIRMHDWNMVDVETTTHDAGNRVTQRDFNLAKKIIAGIERLH